jgi:hypothetical protein
MKSFFERNWQHFAVLGGFIVIMLAYFSPEYDGYHLKQHDIEQYIGMSQEIKTFREKTGDEPLWTNSMFGGMPTVQISTLYDGNIFQTGMIWFLKNVGVPSGILLLHLIGFYILALCLRVRPLIGFIGAVAFAFASYEIVILQAGHNSKAITVALMAPVLGAFIMAYRKNWKWGALLSALFMSFEIASNHLQVTYYFAFVLAGLGVFELVKALRKKAIKQFLITSGAVMAAYLLAVFINYGNVSLTNDYAKQTIRGGNDVTIRPDGELATENTEGLDKDYITNWSYGVDESFTLISPYVKGSASTGIADSPFKELIENSDRSSKDINGILSAPYPVYWGEQPMTSGPVYIGVVMIFLLVLGMYYIKDGSKWVFLGVSILALMLSWGKNMMGLTDFFIEHVPGYNKFRTVTIILVLIELCVPVIGILLLQRLFDEREQIKETKKQFLIISGIFFVLLFGLKAVGLGDNYTSQSELQRINEIPAQVMDQVRGTDPQVLATNYGIDVNNPQQLQQFVDAQVQGATEQYDLMKSARGDIFNSSMNRSLLFTILAIALIALYFYTALPTTIIFGGLGLLVLLDLIPVDQNYLSSTENDRGDYKYWVASAQTDYPLSPEKADLQIMEMEAMDPKVNKEIERGERDGSKMADELSYTGGDKRRVIDSYRFSALNMATNYRVFDLNGGWNSTRASYFHKSLGGYHGAKLRNIQNVFDFHLSRSNNKVLDMLNVKYFIQEESLRPNPTAMGNAWFVRNIKVKNTPNDEIRALGNEFKLVNTGLGIFLVNQKVVQEASVFGTEKIQYLLPGKDTMDVPLSNGISKGMEVLWVMDANGATNLIPAATMQMDSLKSFTKLISVNVTDEFNPANDAVMLKEVAAGLKKRSFSGIGNITMTAYAPNKITYSAECKGDQFAVFSEIYYPEGWKATVDGKEVPILKTDYLLRGLELQNGKHKVEFTFDLPKFRKSNNYALFGSLLLFGLIGGMIFLEYKKRSVEK